MITHGFQPRSAGLMYRIPARDTVAGVAVFRWLISNNSLIDGVSGIRSLLAKVRTWWGKKYEKNFPVTKTIKWKCVFCRVDGQMPAP